MKKLFLKIILASMLILTLCLSVFAAESPETDGFIPEIDTATDKDGNPIDVVLVPTDTIETETIKTVMGDDYTDDMIVVAVQEIIIPDGTTFPVTITFTFKGVTPDTKGAFLIWDGETWNLYQPTFGTDTMTITFDLITPTGRFPVAFVMNTDVTQSQVGTSPQTSDYITAAFTILAISILATLVFSKKRSKVL